MLTNCRTLTELYSQDREGELTRWQRFKLRLHLKLCSPCRAYVGQMDATVLAVKTLHEEPPIEVRDALVDAYRKRNHKD